MNENKRLKDPIYGYIRIPNGYVKNIIDTATFQRLRRIAQTSYSPLYASAIHNRFVHSLGVFHLGVIACDTLVKEVIRKYGNRENWEHVGELFQLACLLHDVGHAPFSHTGEKFYLDDSPKMKKYTCLHRQLIEAVGSSEFEKDVPLQDSKSAAPHEIMSAIIGIRKFSEYFKSPFEKEFFARCITGYRFTAITLVNSIYNCFISLLNSKVIDVDRLDYLIRDAFFSGFDTVNIDYERLLTSLTVIKTETDEEEAVPVQYELAYYKSAISVIENVVYAHDAERKWIQNHPVVLYDMYIIQHISSQLDKKLSAGDSKLFSIESLSEEGQIMNNGMRISLLSDDDILCLMKSQIQDALSREYFSRRERRHPVWKSEAEYNACMLQLIGPGEILKKMEQALIATEKYLGQNSESWVIDDDAIAKLDSELEKMSDAGGGKVDQATLKAQKKTKNNIKRVMVSLQKYAKAHHEKCDFVILSADQFYSGFNKPDVSDINIVFHSSDEEKIFKLGEVVPLLSGEKRETKNLFYLYHQSNADNDEDKEELCRTLISAFTQK